MPAVKPEWGIFYRQGALSPANRRIISWSAISAAGTVAGTVVYYAFSTGAFVTNAATKSYVDGQVQGVSATTEAKIQAVTTTLSEKYVPREELEREFQWQRETLTELRADVRALLNRTQANN